MRRAPSRTPTPTPTTPSATSLPPLAPSPIPSATPPANSTPKPIATSTGAGGPDVDFYAWGFCFAFFLGCPTCRFYTWGTRTSVYSNPTVNYNGGILSPCSTDDYKRGTAGEHPGHPPDSPLPADFSASADQYLVVGGFIVRHNTISWSQSGPSITNLGPFS